MNLRAGDSNQITRRYYDSILIEMRHIDSVIADTRLSLFGESFATPIMMAALSHLNDCHKDGLVEMARGAYAANAVMWAGMGDDAELSAITSTGAKTVKIIKPYEDNDEILRRIAHAEKCGCVAVGIDVDHAFNSKGQHDTVLGLKMTPKTSEELKGFAASTKLPFIIKGVLSERDAVKCERAGVSGIVVSHHHGIMDFAVPPLAVLPKIVDAVKGKMKIFIDCGVESGIDAFKALSLGADAVSVGRAMIGPLSESGADGVKNKISEMTAQLAGVMSRTCFADLGSIDNSVLAGHFHL